MKTETQRFYEWMLRIGNIYVDNNERMVEAFRIVSLNQ